MKYAYEGKLDCLFEPTQKHTVSPLPNVSVVAGISLQYNKELTRQWRMLRPILRTTETSFLIDVKPL